MAWTRRNILLAAPALLLFRPEVAQANTMRTVKKLYGAYLEGGLRDNTFQAVRRSRKIKMGACIPHSQSFPFKGKPREVLQSNFQVFVPEVEFNWDNDTAPRVSGSANQIRLNKIFDLASSVKGSVKGHSLYYYKVFPRKVRELAASSASDAEVEKTLSEWVYERVSFYKGRIKLWNINEVVDYDGSLRPEPMMNRFGPRILSVVGKAALAADPSITLEFCDNNIGVANADRPLKTTFKIIDQMRADGVDISNIGVQGHFFWNDTPDTRLSPYKALKREGLTFSVSELDANDRDFKGSQEDRDLHIAAVYYDYLSAVTQMSNLVEVTSWTPFDTDNWIKRGDVGGGTTVAASRTGWFDESFEPKFLYYATAHALLS